MEKFIKIYYSLLHSDLAHSSQWIYDFSAGKPTILMVR